MEIVIMYDSDTNDRSVDMCLAMEKKEKKDKISGAIEGMKLMGATDNDIISKIIDNFGVSKEYVMDLISPKKA